MSQYGLSLANLTYNLFNFQPSSGYVYSTNLDFISNTDMYVSSYVIDTSAITVGAIVRFRLKSYGIIKGK